MMTQRDETQSDSSRTDGALPLGDAAEASIHASFGGERWTPRQLIGLVLGPTLFLAVLALPLPLTVQQHRLAAILAVTITYWVTEALPIPVTGLLGLALVAVFNVPVAPEGRDVTAAQLVFEEFSSPILFLLIGGLIITRAMMTHNRSQRVALTVLALPGVATSTYRIIFVFGLLGALLSAAIDNGALAAMLLPVAVGLDQALRALIRDEGRSNGEVAEHEASDAPNLTTCLMLMTAYGPTLGALLTPFGDGSNLVGRAFIQQEMGVFLPVSRWMMLAFPVVLPLFMGLTGIVLLLNRPEIRRLPSDVGEMIEEQRQALGPMSRGEVNTAIAFGVAIFLWLVPSAAGLIWGFGSDQQIALASRLDPSVGAIFAACLIFILPLDLKKRRFSLTWSDAMKMDWGPVLLMGTGLAMGSLMGKTGLAGVIGGAIADMVANTSPGVVYIVVAATALLTSELTSNLVSVSVIVPLIPALTEAGGGDPLTASLIATFAAVFGFMLPISTSANAVIYGSGLIPISRMVRTGFVVDLCGVVLIVAGLLFVLSLIPLA